MELIQVGKNTYYIKNPTNIGIYKTGEQEVFLIDSGNDKDAGKKILKILDAEGWRVAGIITTHSHADHTGGCRLIQDRTGCKVYAAGTERCFTEFPLLEPTALYGGYPFRELRNKFLMAKECAVTEVTGSLPEGLSILSLKGHFFDMIGIRTDDDVYFLADSLFSEETITKYHLSFLYDVQAFLHTLDTLSTLEGKCFIPSHCEASEDISALIELNRNKVLEIIAKICELCSAEITFEDLLQQLFSCYGLTMNANQYVLIGSTVRSYLAYLADEGKLTFSFRDNKMYWKQA